MRRSLHKGKIEDTEEVTNWLLQNQKQNQACKPAN